MKASIVLTAHNRAHETLVPAIESAVNQSLSADHHEVLIVDSASTDRTGDVARAMCADKPHARYLHEAVPGVSRARNRGWREARGDIVCFLDDDEIAAPDWARKIVTAFEDGDDDLGCVGGPVRPLWAQPPPPWLTRLHGCIGLVDMGHEPVLTPAGEAAACFIGGGNAAYRREALERMGGFRESMGKRGGRLFLGEDTLALHDLAQQGYRSLYHPEVIVHHHVPAARMRRSYLLRWNYRSGIAVGQIRLLNERPSESRRKEMIRQRLADLRIHVGETLRHAPRHLRKQAFFHQLCTAASVIGNLRAWLTPAGSSNTTLGKYKTP